MKCVGLIVAGIATATLLSAQQPAPAGAARQGGPVAIAVVDLGQGLFLLSGGSNSLLAVGKEAAILVDTNLLAQRAAFLKKVGELTPLPIKYVINTHAHPDHVGANATLASRGATVVATASAARRMAMEYPGPRGTPDPPVAVAGRPKDTFTGTRTISIVGQAARVTALAPAHTDGDAFVYFPAANVLVMGDLHHSNEYPVYDADAGCRCGSFEGNLNAYDAMLKVANEQTRFVPGHGGVTTRAEVTAYVAMLRSVRDQIAAAIQQGKSEEDVVAAQLLAKDQSVTSEGPDNRDQFVRTLYNALKTGQGK